MLMLSRIVAEHQVPAMLTGTRLALTRLSSGKLFSEEAFMLIRSFPTSGAALKPKSWAAQSFQTVTSPPNRNT